MSEAKTLKPGWLSLVVTRSALGYHAKPLLHVLIERWEPKAGTSFAAPYSSIADSCGCSEKTTTRAAVELVEAGLIKRQAVPSATGRTVLWTLHIDAIANLPRKPRTSGPTVLTHPDSQSTSPPAHVDSQSGGDGPTVHMSGTDSPDPLPYTDARTGPSSGPSSGPKRERDAREAPVEPGIKSDPAKLTEWVPTGETVVTAPTFRNPEPPEPTTLPTDRLDGAALHALHWRVFGRQPYGGESHVMLALTRFPRLWVEAAFEAAIERGGQRVGYVKSIVTAWRVAGHDETKAPPPLEQGKQMWVATGARGATEAGTPLQPSANPTTSEQNRAPVLDWYARMRSGTDG